MPASWFVRFALVLVGGLVLAALTATGLVWRRGEQLKPDAIVLTLPVFALVVGLLCGVVTEKHGLPRPEQMRWWVPVSALLAAIGLTVLGVVIGLVWGNSDEAMLPGFPSDPVLLLGFFACSLALAALGTSAVGPFTSLRNNPPWARGLGITAIVGGALVAVGVVVLLALSAPVVTLVIGLVGSAITLPLCAWLNDVVCRPGPPPNPADPSGLGLDQFEFEEFFVR